MSYVLGKLEALRLVDASKGITEEVFLRATDLVLALRGQIRSDAERVLDFDLAMAQLSFFCAVQDKSGFLGHFPKCLELTRGDVEKALRVASQFYVLWLLDQQNSASVTKEEFLEELIKKFENDSVQYILGKMNSQNMSWNVGK